tara:strand:+ start:164 stop:631 length:468 start_codon:yes stop_codon:yes gene_type:complete
MNKILLIILLLLNQNYSIAFSSIIEKISKNIANSLSKDDCISYYNTKIEIKHRIKKKDKIIYKIKKKNKIPIDIIGIRIIYDSENEDISFKILSNIERNFHKIQGTYKNYINNKKQNGYQSLHICIFYYIIPVEIQIRNEEMDYTINYGKPSNYT